MGMDGGSPTKLRYPWDTPPDPGGWQEVADLAAAAGADAARESVLALIRQKMK